MYYMFTKGCVGLTSGDFATTVSDNLCGYYNYHIWKKLIVPVLKGCSFAYMASFHMP